MLATELLQYRAENKSEISNRHVSSSRSTESICLFYHSRDSITLYKRKKKDVHINKTEDKAPICFRATALVTRVAVAQDM